MSHAAKPRGESAEAQLITAARKIHERILSLDSHINFNAGDLTAERNYTDRLDTQFNLPNMIDGGLGGLFFVVYVGQTRESQNPEALKAAAYERAYQLAREKFEAIQHFTTAVARDRIELARSAAEVGAIVSGKKKVALIGVEKGYPLGADIARVSEFYERGARYISLTHNGHNQLADSHTGERDGWKWNGVSPLGKEVIAEMNRLGIMVDVSHASKTAMMQTASLSTAPIIASHSGVRALCDVSRNLDDEQLVALKQTGGVFQAVAYDGFVKTARPDSTARTEAIAAVRREFELPEFRHPGQRARFHAGLKRLPADRRAAYDAKLEAIDREHPGDPPASLTDFVAHIDYAVNLIGIDHVGIASDFDGGGGVEGWNDASETFNVTLELVRRGYTENQIAKLWGGNLLRVLDKVQQIAESRQ